MTFTFKEKRQAIEREIALRVNVYARKVDAGRMKQAKADYEIAVMQAIREDYIEMEKL